MKPFEPTCTGVPPCGRCWSCEADQRDAEAARGREALDVLRVLASPDYDAMAHAAAVARARALLSRAGGTPT